MGWIPGYAFFRGFIVCGVRSQIMSEVPRTRVRIVQSDSSKNNDPNILDFLEWVASRLTMCDHRILRLRRRGTRLITNTRRVWKVNQDEGEQSIIKNRMSSDSDRSRVLKKGSRQQQTREELPYDD